MGSFDLLFGLPQPARRRLRAAAFLAVLAVAGFVRFDGLGEPSLWLDEILHVEKTREAAARLNAGEPSEWLAALRIDRENGPLYYGTQLLSQSFFSDPEDTEFAARWIPALAGVVAVAALYFAVLWASRSGALAIAAMALLAVAPLHVDYSREGRPYSAVILAVVLMLMLAFAPRRRWVVPAVYLLAFATACLGAVAAPVLISLVPVGALSWLLRRHSLFPKWAWRRDLHLAVASGLAMLLMAFLFPNVHGLNKMTGTAVEKTVHGGDVDFASPLAAQSLDRLLTSLTTSGLDSSSAGALSFVMLALALWGAARWTLHDSTAAVWLVGLCLLPIACWLALLYHFGHWYNVRYTSAGLPAFLTLVAYGILDAAGMLWLVTSRLFWRFHPSLIPSATVGGALLTLLVPNWAASRTEPWQKPDWRGAAQLIDALGGRAAGAAAEPVIARDDWSEVCLRFYLRDRSVEVYGVDYEVDVARDLARRHPRGWVASAGYGIGDWFDPFTRGLDVVLRRPKANLRLYRYPDFASIHWENLQNASLDARALIERFVEAPEKQDFTVEEFLLGAGWSSPETDPSSGMTFRWAAAEWAETALAAAECTGETRALRLRAMPFPGRDRPAQTLTVRVNGTGLATVSLEPGWNELILPAYDSGGLVDVVVFEFGWLQSPRDVDPASQDGRRLAVAFDFVESVCASDTKNT